VTAGKVAIEGFDGGLRSAAGIPGLRTGEFHTVPLRRV